MNYGLYLSAQGADIQSKRLDVVANNMANASTTAFKRDLAIFQAHNPFDIDQGNPNNLPEELADMTGGITLSEVATDFSRAPLMLTGNPLDIAIEGDGFFQVTDGKQNFLTRNGNLTVNSVGELVTQDHGHAVLNEGSGRFLIPENASEIQISSSGDVAAFLKSEDGVTRIPLGRIDVVKPDHLDALIKSGASLYKSPGRVEIVENAAIQQGYIESSGTNPVTDMMDMIEASRGFEMNVNMIRSQDEALGQLLQTLPRR